MSEIDEKYRLPLKEISCPGCGQRYGHDDTDVDMDSGECSECVERFGYKVTQLVSAEYFIEKVLGYSPLA